MGSLSRLTSFVLPFLALFNDSVETSQMTTMSAQNNTFIKRDNSKRDGVRYRAREDADRFLVFIYSFSALHDYVELIVLSGAFETPASVLGFLQESYGSISLLQRPSKVTMFCSVNTLSPHLSITELIRRSEWMMFWLFSLPRFRQFRDFSVSTSDPSVEDSALEIDRDGNVDEALQLRIIPV